MVMVIGENAKVDMKDVTLIPNNINTYAFSTDASSTDQNIHINMENVKILPSVIIACPMLCNLPVTFTAKDCVFEGCNQAFIARGGDYTFTNLHIYPDSRFRQRRQLHDYKGRYQKDIPFMVS